MTTIRLPLDLMEQIRATGRPRSDVVREALEEWLARRGRPPAEPPDQPEPAAPVPAQEEGPTALDAPQPATPNSPEAEP